MVQSKLYKGKSVEEFELLCKDGRRMPVSEHLQCNWGIVPSNAIVVSSARTIDERKHIQRFLLSAIKHYSHKKTFNSTSNFNSRENDRNNRNRYDDRFNRYTTTERNPFGYSPTTEAYNDSVLYESFEIFDSSRYGRRLNLLFQVSFNLITN